MDAETFRETVLESVRGERGWTFGTNEDGNYIAQVFGPPWIRVYWYTDARWFVGVNGLSSALGCHAWGSTLDEALNRVRPLAAVMGVEL